MTGDKFRLTKEAAIKYDTYSVPAMFGPLARATMDKVELQKDAHVIDIACGTGALTREIARKLTGRGRIVGVDLNDTMIDLARENQPSSAHDVEWFAADVCDLPCDENAFDYAFIQQGLQFFPDKPAALREIRRVLRPKGQLILTCWRAISPFNGALAEALARHVNEAAARKARAPFSFRDGEAIATLLNEGGFDVLKLAGVVLERRLDDLRAQIMALPIEADLRAAGDAVTDVMINDVAAALAPYKTAGLLSVPQEAHLFYARPKAMVR